MQWNDLIESGPMKSGPLARLVAGVGFGDGAIVGDSCDHFPKLDRQNGGEGALFVVDVDDARAGAGDRADELIAAKLRAGARRGGVCLIHRAAVAEMSYLSVSFVG